MPPSSVEPRPVNSDEMAVLKHVLAVDFDGAAELRSQVDHTEVVSQWQAGSTSVDLRVLKPVARSVQGDGPVPVDATVVDAQGVAIGEVLVWVTDGMLSALEHTWWTDEMPTVLPAPDRIRVRP